MRKTRKAKVANSNGALMCWIALVLVVCAAVKLLTSAGIGNRVENAVRDFWTSEEGTAAIMRFELGVPFENNEIYRLLASIDEKPPENSASDTQIDKPQEHNAESAIPDYFKEDALAQDKTEKLDYTAASVFGDDEHLDPSSVILDNDTGLEIDVDGLLNSPLDFTVESDKPTVLIVHTHGSEAYTATAEDTYTESDPYRTENNNYNVVRVGNELKKELESYGIMVLHDTTLHDYPSYNGSYNRSFETIAEYIDEYPSIKIVIDLHRDAIANSDGTQYRTVAQIGEETCSQLLFVMGTDAAGLEHPAWRENMQLAIKLQYAMNTLYPTLAKPICVSQYRYNQHMTSGSMILEVGCTGNTLKESIASMKYFASAAAQVIGTVN